MKINRNKLIIVFSIIGVGIIGLSIAYAALSTTLNITGSGSVNAADWDIIIEKYPFTDFYGSNYSSICTGVFTCSDNYLMVGNAKVDKLPTLTNTTIKDFALSASIPGDTVMFLYKVINNGTIPAKLESINKHTFVYTSANNNSDDISWAQSNSRLIFSLGTDVDVGDALVEGDILCPGETNYLMIGFAINEDATSLPSGTIEISNGGVDYLFVQADENVCFEE